MPPTRVAVTGASGFIGRHVLSALGRRDVAVCAVTRSAGRLGRLDPDVRVVELDIATADTSAYDRIGRPDLLIHLAWDGLPNYRSPRHLEVELPRQIRFLDTLLGSGLPALLVAGTCFEYGMRSGELSESMDPRPENPYGQAKDRLRRQLELLRTQRNFALTWARLFYTFGEGQPASSLYSQIRAAVARGDRSFPMSGGAQLRDYLPVAELAEYIVKLGLGRGDAGCVNVCSGRPVSIRALVEGWLAANSWSIALDLGHYPYPDYEPMEFWGSRRKLDALLKGDE